eukprot:GHVU01231331.1.p2 GENE.GHVU01231331.1~~GHVU01231331.1.p2  ORF type:complete len:110 (+),score=3.48 GHVU01231331.1:813-1142(+)
MSNRERCISHDSSGLLSTHACIYIRISTRVYRVCVMQRGLLSYFFRTYIYASDDSRTQHTGFRRRYDMYITDNESPTGDRSLSEFFQVSQRASNHHGIGWLAGWLRAEH